MSSKNHGYFSYSFEDAGTVHVEEQRPQDRSSSRAFERIFEKYDKLSAVAPVGVWTPNTGLTLLQKEFQLTRAMSCVV